MTQAARSAKLLLSREFVLAHGTFMRRKPSQQLSSPVQSVRLDDVRRTADLLHLECEASGIRAGNVGPGVPPAGASVASAVPGRIDTMFDRRPDGRRAPRVAAPRIEEQIVEGAATPEDSGMPDRNTDALGEELQFEGVRRFAAVCRQLLAAVDGNSADTRGDA